MPNDLIARADAVKALEEYAHSLVGDGKPFSAQIAFECLRIVRNLPAWEEKGEENA